MDAVKQVYLLIICQDFYLGSVCQDWTFPTTITAVIGSCVEIPCTYNNPPSISGTSGTVWYLYARTSYPEILNSKDSSSVMEEYKDRTSLVPGEKSCTLRIDPVRREDGNNYYYPGIAEHIYINANKQYRNIYLYVTDTVATLFSMSEYLIEEQASIIRCTAEHTCRSRPPSLQWNKPGQIRKKSVDISGGSWREESKLTYIPSYVDDGTPVQCTATYPNGQRTGRSEILNIHYAPKNVSVTFIMMKERDVSLQCSSFSKPAVYEYEWYKGKDKTKLPDTGREITVQNVTRDVDPYSCAVINAVGRIQKRTESMELKGPNLAQVRLVGCSRDTVLTIGQVPKTERATADRKENFWKSLKKFNNRGSCSSLTLQVAYSETAKSEVTTNVEKATDKTV
ncbi:Schwann cell myelin protein-like [Rhinoderma darwinii]|uniref:Schwann cell myelin protein-like n=1 Tax=Rhinoderma darwinii TaxID=43563 RepID=UPI003F6799E6